MKMEEVDLISVQNTLRQPYHSAAQLEQAVVELGAMEKKILEVLDFKLTPDTLIFWLDLIIRLWDLYVEQEASNYGCQ